LRHGDGQIDASTNFYCMAANATTGQWIWHQAIRKKSVQGNDNLGIYTCVFSVAHQIFNSRFMVEDHLGFQRILAFGGLTEFNQAFDIKAAVGVSFQFR
jgi:hypothetical protein